MSRSRSRPADGTGVGPPGVLIVDDNEDILRSLTMLLGVSLEAPIHAAPSGLEALGLLRAHRIAVIVSDYRMPDMDGLEFLARAHDVRPDAARIMITGYPDEDLKARALGPNHLDAFLAKPFDIAQLVELVHTLLAKRPAGPAAQLHR